MHPHTILELDKRKGAVGAARVEPGLHQLPCGHVTDRRLFVSLDAQPQQTNEVLCLFDLPQCLVDAARG